MSSRHEVQRREKNRSSLKDYLDGVLSGLHPGSPDMEAPVDDNQKGSRILLYERSLKRFEKPEQHRTHRLLTEVLMVSEKSRLAVEDRLAHSALSEFVFPFGYQALVKLEAAARDGDPLAAEPAAYCRRGFEKVLDYLDELDYEIHAPILPQSGTNHPADVDRRHDSLINTYDRVLKDTGSPQRAVEAASEESGYHEKSVYRILRNKAS